MKIRDSIAGALAVVMGFAAVGQAQERAYVVTRSGVVDAAGDTRVFVPLLDRDAVGVIYRPVLVPQATVSEAVSETPALPHLALVRLGAQTVLLDPDADLELYSEGRLDDNHTLLKAQRLHKELNARGAYIVRGVPRHVGAVDAGAIRPSAVILKPNLLDKPRRDEVDNMPMIPSPQEAPASGRKVALAE